MIASLALEVVRGGSPAQRPASARMTLAQGETATISCTLTRSDTGAAINLTGCAVQFAMARRQGGDVVLSRALTVVSAVAGTLTLEFGYDDTAELAVGDYACDIWLVDADDARYPVLGLSTFSLTEAIGDADTPVSVLPTQPVLGLGPTGAAGADGADSQYDIEEAYVPVAELDGTTIVVAYDDPFATEPLLDVGPAFCADQQITLTVVAWSTTGFSVEASAAFAGKFKYRAKGTFA